MRSRTVIANCLVAVALTGHWAAKPILAVQASRSGPPRCDTADYRLLDFWIGSWDVTTGGQPVGKSQITLEEDGCVIHERWTGAKGGTGQSFNYFDRVDQQWHQMWVSNSGNVLALDGTFAGGTLTYHGERRQPDGTTLLHRLSFSANPDGTVHQLWETSSDGGSTWSIAFDGLYRKKQG